jgi:hypothetical protein
VIGKHSTLFNFLHHVVSTGIYTGEQLAFGQAIFGIVVFFSVLLFVYPRILSNPVEVSENHSITKIVSFLHTCGMPYELSCVVRELIIQLSSLLTGFHQAEDQIEEGLVGRLDWIFTARFDKPYVYIGEQNK